MWCELPIFFEQWAVKIKDICLLSNITKHNSSLVVSKTSRNTEMLLLHHYLKLNLQTVFELFNLGSILIKLHPGTSL